MTDAALLRHYGLSEQFPDTWQDVDVSLPVQQFKSTESDALGTGQSVSRILYERGIIQTETGIPAEYSIDSKTFDARAYIRNVHRKATQTDLLRGQEYLARAIDSKAGSLKTLVEDNFDRFVGSKRVIDDVHAHLSNDFSHSDNAAADTRMNRLRKTLNDTSVKATQVFEPVIENRRKSDIARSTVGVLEQYSAHFDLPSVLLKCIEAHDSEALLKEYKKGQALFKDVATRNKADAGSGGRNARLLNRVWSEVEGIMKAYEARIWRALEEQRHTDIEATTKLANFLLDLGVDTNPYHRAYLKQNLSIKEATTRALAVDRTRVEVLRRNLQIKYIDSKRDRLVALAAFVSAKSLPSETSFTIPQSQDDLVYWDSVTHLVNDVWTKPVSSIAENWRIVQNMTNARSIKLLPNGPDGSSRRFHSFTQQEQDIVTKQTEETIDLMCQSLSDFLVSRPMDKLPTIYTSNSGDATAQFAEFGEVPELPDLGGKDLPEFSFLPVSCNSLGAAEHLSTLMSTIMSGVTRLHSHKISAKADDLLQKMMSTIRERFIRAICELWQADSDDLPLLEVWEKAGKTDGSTFPHSFYVIQKAIIDGISRIMFKNELMPVPSQRLLGNVRQQFIKNVYQVINGLMTASYSASSSLLEPTRVMDIEVKKLFTIINLRIIQASTLAQLIQTIESAFTISLTPDLPKINGMFSQYIQKLTTSFLAPRLSAVDATMTTTLSTLNWTEVAVPSDISLWTNQVLLDSITTHALIALYAPSLLSPLLEAIISHIFQTLHNQVAPITRISVGGMLQVTLDMEFLSVQYATWMPARAKTLMEEIFTLIDSRTAKDKVTPNDKAEVKRILSRAARRWNIQADVFRTPLLAAPSRR